MAKEPAFWYTDIQALLVVAPCRGPQPRDYSTFEVDENVFLSPYGVKPESDVNYTAETMKGLPSPYGEKQRGTGFCHLHQAEGSSVPLRGETAKVFKKR